MEKILQDLVKRDMNVIHGGIGGCLKVDSGGATLDFTNMEKNALLMKKYGFKKWIIELTGLPNTFVDKMKCGYYDSAFNKAYKDMLKQIKDKADKGGWPEIQVMYDEPREEDSDNPRPLARTYWDMENLIKLHNEAGLQSLPTFMSDNGGKRHENKSLSADYFELCKLSKYSMTHGWDQSRRIMSTTVASGNTLYLYNCGYGRFPYGILTYKLGAKGNVQFWYSGGNKMDTAAQFPTSYAVVTSADGPFIPVLRWLRSVEGVHDFWYIKMLERAVAGAGDKNSADVAAAKSLLEELKGAKLAASNADQTGSETLSSETLKSFAGTKLDTYKYKMGQLIAKLKK
jgi:hypothetical protein